MSPTPSNRAVLIVDDDDGIRGALAEYLERHGYGPVEEARNGEEALARLEHGAFFLVVTDISMPAMGGLELLAEVRRRWPDTDVAVVTGHLELDFAIQALKEGAFDYFKKPFRFEEVLETCKRVERKQYLEHRSRELERIEALREAEERHLVEFMLALARIIDMKSPYTREHSDRTAKIARIVCRVLGLTGAEVERVALGARLHDIGKVAVPDCILDKPGPLTVEEYEVMKQHPGRGAELCGNVHCLERVVPMIRWHHENLDGTGYPDGLRGDELPLDARIVRVADYWDAVTSRRSYREPMSEEQAVGVITEECSAGRLDADVCEALFRAVREGKVSRVRAPETIGPV